MKFFKTNIKKTKKTKYFIGIMNSGDTKVAFQTAKEADYVAEEWVEMEAYTLDEAFAGYEDAFDEWEAKQPV